MTKIGKGLVLTAGVLAVLGTLAPLTAYADGDEEPTPTAADERECENVKNSTLLEVDPETGKPTGNWNQNTTCSNVFGVHVRSKFAFSAWIVNSSGVTIDYTKEDNSSNNVSYDGYNPHYLDSDGSFKLDSRGIAKGLINAKVQSNRAYSIGFQTTNMGSADLKNGSDTANVIKNANISPKTNADTSINQAPEVKNSCNVQANAQNCWGIRKGFVRGTIAEGSTATLDSLAVAENKAKDGEVDETYEGIGPYESPNILYDTNIFAIDPANISFPMAISIVTGIGKEGVTLLPSGTYSTTIEAVLIPVASNAGDGQGD